MTDITTDPGVGGPGGENPDELSTRQTEKEQLIGQVRDLRVEAKKDHHLDLPIPGYQRLLWARYRPFPSSKSERGAAELRKAASQGLPIMLNASIDTLIDACEQI